MASQCRQLKKLTKDAKRMIKRINLDRGMTVRKSFDVNTAVYADKHEKYPLVTFNARGDYSFPVLKVVLIFLAAVSVAAVLALTLQSVADRIRERKYRRMLRESGNDQDDGYEIPF